MTNNLLMGTKNKWIALAADSIKKLSHKIKGKNQNISFLNVPPANTSLSL